MLRVSPLCSSAPQISQQSLSPYLGRQYLNVRSPRGSIPSCSRLAAAKPRRCNGPVLTIVTFKDEQEVLVMANDIEYGLAAYIQTSKPGHGAALH
ncbi:hypothetical protein F5B17DRAFT_396336 [Nemania serpens]|nr:hypothetical protein F5B17DRAFT_396336 [Nemania serpens]